MTRPLMYSSMVVTLLGTLVGCASEPRALLEIQLTDAATGAPVVGAKVQAETAARNHPLSVASVLGQAGPVTSTEYTDEDGRAALEYLSGRPVRVAALARMYPILTVTIEEPWLGPSQAESDRGPDGKMLRVSIFSRD